MLKLLYNESFSRFNKDIPRKNFDLLKILVLNVLDSGYSILTICFGGIIFRKR